MGARRYLRGEPATFAHQGHGRRQARGSNVYYSVNRPCPAGDQKGFGGKCNVDDIIAIRALAFDIDIIKRPFDSATLGRFHRARIYRDVAPIIAHQHRRRVSDNLHT